MFVLRFLVGGFWGSREYDHARCTKLSLFRNHTFVLSILVALLFHDLIVLVLYF